MGRAERPTRPDVPGLLRMASSFAVLLVAVGALSTGAASTSTVHYAMLTLLGFGAVFFGLVQWTGTVAQRLAGAVGALMGLWPVIAAFGSWPRLGLLMALGAGLAGIACAALECLQCARR